MRVKEGDKVKVNYEGKLENGEIFDTSWHGGHSHPIEFTVGNHEVIKGFEENVLGMEEGTEREFMIQPEDAYGEKREELVREFPRSQIPIDKNPEVGMVLGLMTPDGRQIHATITKVTKDSIILDLNHPLAGKRLIFDIELKEIINPKEEKEAAKEEKIALKNLKKTLEEEANSQNLNENFESPDEEALEERMEEVIEDSEEKE